jgi:hypothetical protein
LTAGRLASSTAESVLQPTIAPELDYDNLDQVQSGDRVEPVYFEMIDPVTSAQWRQALERALLTY